MRVVLTHGLVMMVVSGTLTFLTPSCKPYAVQVTRVVAKVDSPGQEPFSDRGLCVIGLPYWCFLEDHVHLHLCGKLG